MSRDRERHFARKQIKVSIRFPRRFFFASIARRIRGIRITSDFNLTPRVRTGGVENHSNSAHCQSDWERLLLGPPRRPTTHIRDFNWLEFRAKLKINWKFKNNSHFLCCSPRLARRLPPKAKNPKTFCGHYTFDGLTRGAKQEEANIIALFSLFAPKGEWATHWLTHDFIIFFGFVVDVIDLLILCFVRRAVLLLFAGTEKFLSAWRDGKLLFLFTGQVTESFWAVKLQTEEEAESLGWELVMVVSTELDWRGKCQFGIVWFVSSANWVSWQITESLLRLSENIWVITTLPGHILSHYHACTRIIPITQPATWPETLQNHQLFLILNVSALPRPTH